MKKKILASILSLVIVFCVGAASVYAQLGPGSQAPTGPGGSAPTGPGSSAPTGPSTLPNPFKGCGDNQKCTLFDLLKTIVEEIIMPIAAVLAMLGFIYAGFKYITARGNETKIKEAHRTLLYVAVGTAALLGAWAIGQVIQNTINKVIAI